MSHILKKVDGKITCAGVTSFIFCSPLAWFLLRERMSTSFCSDKTIPFHLIVTGDIFGSFFMALSPRFIKKLLLLIWILVFSGNFSYLTNMIFTAVCWLLLWHDYLYQFRGLKILSQIWLQIVLWKRKVTPLPGAFRYIFIANLLLSVGFFLNWKRNMYQVNNPTFQLPAAKFCSAPAAPSSVSGFEHSERSVR